MTKTMTKDDAKKVIACAINVRDLDCDDCPQSHCCNRTFLDNRECEKHVHAAAKVLYGGNDRSRRDELAEKFLESRINSGASIDAIHIDDAFANADYFISLSQEQ